MENLQGTLLKGYKLQERIGTGGFGAVYRAQQTTIGREVAVKIILPGYANNPDFIRRFESEAHLIARLEHPHITPLHDFWRDPNGAYLVMRYLRGGSVRDALESGTYELHAVSQLLDQIASALDFAHRNEVIHRDIKPGNILLDEDGNSYLADFGIAKDLAGIADNKTGADAVVGSLDYISPEQARSEPVTPRTDIYSLGVTLYEIITGQHPFNNTSSIERLYKHINDPLPDILNLPDTVRDAINEIIQTATAKNPEERYSDVLSLAVAFRDAIGLGTTRDESVVGQLTFREQEILSLIAHNMSNRDIAETLVVTVGTVKWHINQVYKKLGVRSRVQAIVRARELNLIITGETYDFAPTVIGSSQEISLPEPENPYKGLHAFQMTDARDFFGRDELIQKFIDYMCDDDPYYRFLAIVGPSGSGKSSLVKAGLIPALWKGAITGSEKWFVVDMMPGTHPLDKLEIALMRVAAQQTSNLREQLQRDERGLLRVADLILPGDDTELVIVVDQFEEVFTLVEDEPVRQQFLDLLRVAVSDVRSRVRVVITLRADYYDRPLHYPEFGELIRNRMETVLPLSAKGLERAIRGPAERVGVTFEQGLVEQIVSAMNYQAGALPLLQYALTELFDRRDGRLMTQDAYQTIGGAVGALANRADEVYNSLIDEAQTLAHQMFMRLVTLGEGAEDTRRRVSHAELLSLTDNTDLMEEVIDQFAAYRLLSLDHDPDTRQPTVEVAHEAILREWDRLRAWLNDSRNDIRQERAISRAVEDWDTHRREKSYLLRGVRLEQVEKWQESSNLILTPLEQEFIDHSIHNREIELEAEQARKKRETHLELRSRNALRGLVVVFAVAACVSIGFGLVALNRQNIATTALEEAERSAAEFRSVALASGASEALDNGQPDMALALALEATNMTEPPPTAAQTFLEVATSDWIQRRFLVSSASVFDAVYHPDDKHIITTSWDGRIVVWDIATGQELQAVQIDDRPLRVEVHPDGNLVAVAGFEGPLRLWNLETNEVSEPVSDEVSVRSMVFTHDGKWMVTGTISGSINIWDMETLTMILSFQAHEGMVFDVAFSDDETLLVTSSLDGFARVWDFQTNELLQELDLGSWIFSAQFLPDGKHVLIGAGSIVLWNWESNATVWSVEGHFVQDIALSPDKRTFVVGYDDLYPVAELRAVETGQLLRTYQGHTKRIQNVDFASDGKTVLTGSNDGTAILFPVNWEGTTSAILAPFIGSVVWHPTRPLIATFGLIESEDAGLIRLINIQTGEIVQEFEGHREFVLSATFTPDGHYLLSGDYAPTFDQQDQRVYVWDIETGEQVQVLERYSGWIEDIAISPDGQITAIGESQGTDIELVETETWQPIASLEGNQDSVTALVFSPDSKYLYSGSRDGTLFQWDMGTGEISKQFPQQGTSINDLDINSDGSRITAATSDQTAVVWGTTTGEVIMTLRGHTDWLSTAQFSPDGTRIMTGSADGRMILWDSQTGELLQVYAEAAPRNRDARQVAVFSPDSKRLASAANGILTIWDTTLSAQNLESWVAEHRYIPDFTCKQRALYQIEPLCEPEP